MSRIPQSRSSTRSPSVIKEPSKLVPPSPSKLSGQSPSSPRLRTHSGLRATTPTTPRIRKQSTTPRAVTPSNGQKFAVEPIPSVPPTPSISIREAIALKRAEAKKVQAKITVTTGTDNWGGLEDAAPDAPSPEEEDILGRMSVRDSIERARSTGSLNLATRSLPCLPSALFEIHLNITPERLKSVPEEPVLPPSDTNPGRRGRKPEETAWFEAQDLTVLKASNNEIQEIQHEISLFGSLKTVNLHRNRLIGLPNSFADLTALTILDLSHNTLSMVPENLFALPELTNLNLSHNQLSSLPFNAPFKDSNRLRATQQSKTNFFGPVVIRSTAPLPRLLNLDVSHNRLSAQSIDEIFPVSLTKVDLSSNPLGHAQQLVCTLASLKRLKEVRFAHTEIGDEAFQPSVLPTQPFPSLRLLDLEDTQVHMNAIKEALESIPRQLNFDFVNDEPQEGVLRILVGERIIREAWEIELEKRTKIRAVPSLEVTDVFQSQENIGVDTRSPPRLATKPKQEVPEASIVPLKEKAKDVQKEDWEIELEQGLGTEGGRRRARAAAAAAAVSHKNAKEDPVKDTLLPTSSGLANSQYYTAATRALHLPSSAPPLKAGHARAFSVTTPVRSSKVSSRPEDLTVPAPTLPLSTIVEQSFAPTLRSLTLSNRRMDKSFQLPSLPQNDSSFLPCLEELDLEGCNLNDLVPTVISPVLGVDTPPRSNQPLIPLVTKLFPNLVTLNLSHNLLTNESFSMEDLSSLIYATSSRKGLRQLRLRGNRISELDGFSKLAERFRGHRQVPEWRLEELDIRDNEISKLAPELGVLPLDVFLVDGNTFRAPQRRVWEREGTKGLLSWLRGRLE